METNQQNQDEIEIDLLELLRVLWSKIGYVCWQRPMRQEVNH